MSATFPTPWAVICPQHGQVFMTEAEYIEQLDNVNDIWRCTQLVYGADLGPEPPVVVTRPCGLRGEWDDENYEMREGGEG